MTKILWINFPHMIDYILFPYGKTKTANVK